MKLPIVAKGLLTFVMPPALYNRDSGKSRSARYCYSVYLRHLVMLAAAGAETDPRVVAEIGPGASVGVGLAALAAGAEAYHGLETKDYGRGPDDVPLFDELVALLRARSPVPGGDEFPNIKPVLDDESFPRRVLTDKRLERALDPDRVGALRKSLAGSVHAEPGAHAPVSYAAPWFESAVIREGTVDWILSQAVMEHVDDLEETYRACYAWLAPGGWMSHQIDYKCHGTAPQWNGHWSYSDFTWRLVRGGRGFLINRQPHSAHLAALRAAGFDIAFEKTVVRHDGLPRARLSARFRSLDDDDLAVAGAFILCRKPEKRRHPFRPDL